MLCTYRTNKKITRSKGEIPQSVEKNMATDTLESRNISAFNWCIQYVGPGELTFIEICKLVSYEFPGADIIMIDDPIDDKQMIMVYSHVSFTYTDVLKKLEKCRYQIIIEIDIDEETKFLSTE